MANEGKSQGNTQQISTSDWVKGIQKTLMEHLENKIKALPEGFNKDRFVLNSITMINDMLKDEDNKKKLASMSQGSIVMCLMKGAFLGLDFLNRECYAIPYENRDTKRMELNFQTDYKGEIKVCKKHSINPIKDIFAKVVREGDMFSESVEDGRQKLTFNPVPFSTEKMVGAFAVVVYKDGSMLYETMSAEEIEDVRNKYSKAKNSPAWQKSPGEMYKKTVLRRLCKFIELDFDVAEQLTAFQDGAGVEFDNTAQAAKPLAIAEKEKPVDVMQQIRAKQESKKPEPVKEPVAEPEVIDEPPQAISDEEYAMFEEQYMASQPADPDEMPFK